MRKKELRKWCTKAGSLLLCAGMLAGLIPEVAYAEQKIVTEILVPEDLLTANALSVPVSGSTEAMEVPGMQEAVEMSGMPEVMSVKEPDAVDVQAEVNIEAVDTPEREGVYQASDWSDASGDYKPYADATYELQYVVGDEGIVIVSFRGNLWDNSQLVVPEKIKDIPVVAIGDFAFSHYELTDEFEGGLIIPDSVTYIGDYAFSGVEFDGEIVIPDSVTYIGDYAFQNCTCSNINIEFADSITEIGDYVFDGCSGLKGELELPDSVTQIGDYAFYGCGLEGDLKLPDNLVEIGDYAFGECSGITGDLIIPDSVTEIGEKAFTGCGFNGKLQISKGMTDIGKWAFYGCGGLTGDLVIPGNIQTIGEEAFRGCRGFDGELILSEKLTDIEDYAFANCFSLTGDLVIPNSVTDIGSGAFRDCYGFNGELTLSENIISIGSYAFYGCSGLTGDLVFPASVERIEEVAFDKCGALSGNIRMNSEVTAIESHALDIFDYGSTGHKDGVPVIYAPQGSAGKLYAMEYGLQYRTLEGKEYAVSEALTYKPDDSATYELTYVECGGEAVITGCTGEISEQQLLLPTAIGDSEVIAIGKSAFYGKNDFSGELILPDTVKMISQFAFNACDGFSGDLIIPDSVVSIGQGAFCDFGWGIGELQLSKNLTCIENKTFAGIHVSGELEIPQGVKEIRGYAFEDSGFVGDLSIPDSVVSIGNYAFTGCAFSGELSIPDSVVTIGQGAFESCSGLGGDLIIPDSVVAIDSRAFRYASGFDGKLVLSKNLTEIESETFEECSGFTGDLIIPDSVTDIGTSAFYKCSGFDGGLKLSSGLHTIGDQAFGVCSGLTGELILPKGLEQIGKAAFGGCSGFTGDLIIPEGITLVQGFGKCSGFDGKLVLPESAKIIGYGAFTWCTGLNGKLIIPKGVTKIEDYSFEFCTGLDGGLQFPEGLHLLGNYSFRGCTGLSGGVTIPVGVSITGKDVFSNGTGLSGSLKVLSKCTELRQMAINDMTIYAPGGSLAEEYALENEYDFVEWNGDSYDSNSNYTYTVRDDGVEIIAYDGSVEGQLIIPEKIDGMPVTRIGESVFENCSDFTGELVLPGFLKEIGAYAFAGCSGFTGELILPDGITEIGANAFLNCSGFTGNLLIPQKVIRLGMETGNAAPFSGCTGLGADVYFVTREDNSAYVMNPDAFNFTGGDRGSITIHAPIGSYAAEYAQANGYSYVDERALTEAEKNQQKELETLQPLPDSFELEIVGREDTCILMIVDELGNPVADAAVAVMYGSAAEPGLSVTYRSNEKGIVEIDADGDPKTISVEYTGMLPAQKYLQQAKDEVVTITLKKNNNVPVITDVSATNAEGEVISLLTEALVMKSGEDKTYRIKVQTQNIHGEDLDKVQLVQGNRVLAEANWTGEGEATIELLTRMLSETNTAVYVRGIKGTEILCSRQVYLQLLPVEWVNLMNNGTTIELGNQISVDVEDEEVPKLWGEGKLKINTRIMPPLEIEMIGNKVKIYVGETKNLLAKYDKKVLSKAGIMECLEMNYNRIAVKTPDIPVYPCFTVGFAASAEVNGYLEGEFFPDRNEVVATGMIYVKFSGSGNVTFQPEVMKVKLPAKITLKGEISNQFGMGPELRFKDGELQSKSLEIENELSETLTLTGVLGVEDWWDYKAEGQLGITWVHTVAPEENPDTVYLKGNATVTHTNPLGATKIYWRWPEDIDLYEDGFQIFPALEEEALTAIPEDIDVLTVKESASELLPGDCQPDVMGTEDSEEAVVKGIYPYSEPKLVNYEGTQYLFYINYMASGEDEKRTALVYRTNAGSGWSEENPVEDDGTADFDYDVVTSADGVHVIWQNAEDTLADRTETEKAAAIGLKTADIVGTKVKNIKNVTVTEGRFPFSPGIFTNGDTVQLGWYENSENDINGTGVGSSTFYLQTLGEEERTILAETDYYFGSAEFGMFGEKACAVFSVDVDGDFGTMDDREIMQASEGQVSSLTFNAGLDSCPKLFELGDKQYLIYYSDGTLVVTDGTQKQELLEKNAMLSDSYRVFSIGDTVAVVWKEIGAINGEESSLYMLEYKDGAWNDRGSILNGIENVNAFSLGGSEEKLHLVYTLYTAAQDGENVTLCVKAAEAVEAKARVIMTALDYDADGFVPGENFPISLTLADAGMVAMEECIVCITDEQEKVMWERTLTELPSGEKTVNVEINDFCPENNENIMTYSLLVLCDGEETVRSPFKLGGVDFAVSHDISYDENEKILKICVENSSQITGDAILTISTEADEPKELVRKTYEGMEAEGRVYYICKLDALMEQAEGAKLKVAVQTDTEESTYVNNEILLANYLAPIASTDIKLKEAEVTLTVGEEKTLKTVLEGNTASAVPLTWKSSSPTHVTVDTSGNIKALAAGSAYITVTTSEGNMACCKVNVEKPPVRIIYFSDNSLELEVGDRVVLKANMEPGDAADRSVTWTSDDTEVVQVRGGNLIAVKAGTTTIRVTTDNGKKASCSVTVTGEGEALVPEPDPEPDPEVPDGDDPEQKPDGGESGKEPEGDDSEQKPDGGESGKDPEGDDSEQKPDGGESGKEPEGDDSEQKPDGDDTEKEPDGDDPEQKPDEDDTGKNPEGDDNEQKPGGDDIGKEPEGDNPEQDPDEDDSEQTPDEKDPEQDNGEGDPDEPEVRLADVDPDSWQYAPALYVYRRGIMTGKGTDANGNIIFDPGAKLTRQELAQMLYSAEGKPAVAYAEKFADVKDKKWYTNAVLWAADEGIVSGYPNGNFGVDDEITREQLAAMLYRYAEYKGYDISARAEFAKFTDVNRISGWAVEKIQWAVANGVMSGKGDRIDPAGSATRAECAAMLRSFMVKFEEKE